jgi:hypothetical protein
VSIILNSVVYTRIYLYRRKVRNSIGPQTFEDYQTTSSCLKTDSQSLFGIGIYCLTILAFATTTLSASQVSNGKPEYFNDYPYTLFIYYQFIASPGLIGLLFVCSCYNRNKNLRKTVFNEIRNIWLNKQDIFCKIRI